jgi:hypothetical protein
MVVIRVTGLARTAVVGEMDASSAPTLPVGF